MKKIISCFECDSEYIIDYEEGSLSDDPQFCVVCKELIASEDIDEEDNDNEE